MSVNVQVQISHSSPCTAIKYSYPFFELKNSNGDTRMGASTLDKTTILSVQATVTNITDGVAETDIHFSGEEVGSRGAKVRADSIQVRALFLPCNGRLLAVSSRGERRSSFSSLVVRALIPS